MYFGGKPLGDDLTDNAYVDDGYRFHDVIHLALIAHLGWSPVVRGLMRRKRKSKMTASTKWRMAAGHRSSKNL
jgi:hypothetical protein